ncbi:NAD(P)H-dependent glycerol-3-phosphate dehydrogenase [Acetobacteraceae bacterium]|nr:NAD(P)H-dependent glycerol-3-phosphate dehydrogenase [Acetobacteraceae bacterium]
MTEKSISSLHIIGSGAWGSALATAYSRFSPFRVNLWSRKLLKKEEPFPRLPSCLPPEKLSLKLGIPTKEDISFGDIVLLAIPTQALRRVCEKLPKEKCTESILITCCKGLERHTNLMPLDIVSEILPNTTKMVLAGPNFAKEISENLPAAATLAGNNINLVKKISHKLSLPSFSIHPCQDTISIQILCAAKNVLAVGVGALMGAKMGENARAAFILYFLQELRLLITHLSGKEDTIFTFGGLGDLFLTATSSASRNYSLGEYLGQHKSYPPDAGTDKVAVTEGALTAPVLLELAQSFGIQVPIIESINQMLNKPSTIEQHIRAVFAR